MKRLLQVAGLSIGLTLAPMAALADVYRPSSSLELGLKLSGSPAPLGCIASSDGGVYNNHTTTGACSAFNNTGAALKGKLLLVYAPVAGRVLPGTTNAASVSATAGAATAGVPLKAGERVTLIMLNNQGWLAWLPAASGGAPLEVWELQ